MRSLHQDGLVVVENAIPHDCLDRLNEKMVADAYILQAKKEDGPFNYNPGNIQQDAPPVRKHFDPRIFMSELGQPIIIAIDNSLLNSVIRPDSNPNHDLCIRTTP